jgi:hypothetical protein
MVAGCPDITTIGFAEQDIAGGFSGGLLTLKLAVQTEDLCVLALVMVAVAEYVADKTPVVSMVTVCLLEAESWPPLVVHW